MSSVTLVAVAAGSLLPSLLAGRCVGHRGAHFVSIFAPALAFLASALIWGEICFCSTEVCIDLFGPWFELGSFSVTWTLYYDLLTAHMLWTVTGVSFAVHCYALVYMRNDPHLTLSVSYLSLFTFFMLVLVTAENLVVMLVGWEGIGVCSYLLIGYWSHRLSAVKSAGKAILVNRISDGLLMWGVLWIWHHTGSLEYDLINLSSSSSASSFPALAVLIGAMGKSAQMLFHVWLVSLVSAFLTSACCLPYLLAPAHVTDLGVAAVARDDGEPAVPAHAGCQTRHGDQLCLLVAERPGTWSGLVACLTLGSVWCAGAGPSAPASVASCWYHSA